MVDTGILFSNMKSPNDILTLDPYSDCLTDQTFHQFQDLDTELDLHRITSGCHGAFAMVVACQQGTLTFLDTWFRPTIGAMLMLQF